ncbi:hypothetical protein B0H19DRAFT_1274963 [Mycena capillaripes]|nr:hypothetical protein B0H19DRAFT_1274963 [Mycena capillaripes]
MLLKVTANQLATAPTVPSASRSSVQGITDQDLRDSMPTYEKVGTFLFKVLAKELQAGRKADEFVHHSSANTIMAAFKTQFELYSRQYPPFSARAATWSTPMQYWKAMSQLPDASILAFVAIKIFSILPNSMPEERTVSRFTRNDTVDRASQDASTIVDMTKIYQYNKRLKRQSMPEKSATDANVAVATTDATANSTPKVTRTVACEAGLTAVNTVDPADSVPSTVSGEKTFSSYRDGVDITAPFFRDLLADKPIAGADVVGILANSAERAAGGMDNGKKRSGNTTWEGEVDTLKF